MKKEILSDLLDVTKNLDEKYHLLQEIFGSGDEFLAHEISTLWKIIGDYIGLPKEIDGDNSFGREFLINLLSDFGSGEISKKDTIKELIKWNNWSNEESFV